LELTSLGAAYLAGLAVGFWQSTKELEDVWQIEHRFEPQMTNTQRDNLLTNWHEAVKRSLNWIKA
jgi:glycerol kinase